MWQVGTQALYSAEVSAGGKCLGPSAALTSAFVAQLGVRTCREAPRGSPACRVQESFMEEWEKAGG